MKTLFVGMMVLLLALTGVGAYKIYKINKAPIVKDKVACTKEARLCADGSSVGRSGPNCEFAKCPLIPIEPTATSTVTPPTVGTSSTVVTTGTLSGTLDIGPVCPVEREDNPCKPTPEMYAANPVAVYKSDKKTLVTTMVSGSDGRFSALLPVGDYFIDMLNPKRGGIGMASGVPVTLTIKKGEITTLHIDIDTGIR